MIKTTGKGQISLGGISYQLEERFKSKKNSVYRASYLEEDSMGQDLLVIKKYLQPYDNIKNEIELLLDLKEKGLTVPRIYHKGSNYIVMEHIEGCLLLNKIEEREKRSSNTYRTNKDLIKKLLGWLEEFYQLGEGRIIRDINLRNFILTNDGVLYGIDFEDVSLGEIGEDIGKLCAFILTYYPALTWWKLEFTRELFNLSLEQFSLDRDNLLRELDKQINKINKKRKKNYSLKSFKDILLADAQ